MASVNRLRTILTLLLALLWLPVTVHCRLESIPGIEFLSCCLHAEPEQTQAHQDNDCETDGCATVESGLYKQEDSPSEGLINPLLPLPDCISWANDEVSASPITCATPSSAPPELSVLWQFSLRAASQPRAPSSAS